MLTLGSYKPSTENLDNYKNCLEIEDLSIYIGIIKSNE